MPWVLTHPSLWLQSVCLSVDPSVPGPKSCSRKESEVQGPFCHFHLTCPQAHPASTQRHPLLNLQSEDLPPHVTHWPQACLQIQEGEAGAGPAGAWGQYPAVHCPLVTTSRLSPPWLEAPEQGEHTFVGFGGRPASKGSCVMKSAANNTKDKRFFTLKRLSSQLTVLKKLISGSFFSLCILPWSHRWMSSQFPWQSHLFLI